MKILLLNGPPSSGKDTLANYLCEKSASIQFWKQKMAKPLKDACAGLYGLSPEEYEKIDNDPILKNQKMDKFLGYSWREVLIAMSEEYVKNKHGKQTFGQLLANRIQIVLDKFPKESDKFIFVVSDCGFYEEVVPLVEKFGKDSVVLVRLVRPDCNYSIDSRSYIESGELGIRQYELQNTSTKAFNEDPAELQKYYAKGLELVNQITQ